MSNFGPLIEAVREGEDWCNIDGGRGRTGLIVETLSTITVLVEVSVVIALALDLASLEDVAELLLEVVEVLAVLDAPRLGGAPGG